jgi:hypothetical protein
MTGHTRVAKPYFRHPTRPDESCESDILVLLPFDPDTYGPRVADILLQDRSGADLRPMDLYPRACASETARNLLLKSSARDLFPGAHDPESALSGLFLYFSCLKEAHELVHRFDTTDGAYWHGIMHRMEGDSWNSGHWFRRVGSHPVFSDLSSAAAEPGYSHPGTWDPFTFIQFCEASAQAKNDELAKRVQLAEWQLLFDYCAKPASIRTPR